MNRASDIHPDYARQLQPDDRWSKRKAFAAWIGLAGAVWTPVVAWVVGRWG